MKEFLIIEKGTNILGSINQFTNWLVNNNLSMNMLDEINEQLNKI